MVAGAHRRAEQQLHARRRHRPRAAERLGRACRARRSVWLATAALRQSPIRNPQSAMVICLVTDRRRLGAAIGAGPGDLLDALEEQILAAAEVDVDLVQIREADLEAGPLTSLVRSLAGKLRGRTTQLLVNDRLDVALAAGAGGVHLKESSLAPELARRLAATAAAADTPARFIVTCAVHTPLTATARHSADFLIAGTVLPTVSKAGADYLEWKGLGEVIAAA